MGTAATLPKALVAIPAPERAGELARALGRLSIVPTLAFTAEQALGCLGCDRYDVVVIDAAVGAGGLEAHFRAAANGALVSLGAPDAVSPADLDADAPVDLVAARAAAVAAGFGARSSARVLSHGPLELRFATRTATWRSEPIALTPAQFRILVALAAAGGAVVTARELAVMLWGKWLAGDDDRLFAHIRRIRKLIEPDPSRPRFLLTVRGEGYRLAETDDRRVSSEPSEERDVILAPRAAALRETAALTKGDTMSATPVDSELKARHRAMWASGDYPSMVETFLLPLGPRLVEACAIGPGMRVLDVAAGTGNASIPAAERGASVTASDLTPELFEAGRRRAEAVGVELEWVEADAENLPFEDESYDVVMSSIGAMFAPHHQAVADELVRVCRRGGRIGLLSWTPEGMLGALFRTMGPFAAPPPPGAQPPPLWGSESHLRELMGDRVEWRTLERDVLEITAFERPRDYGEHFKAFYGPTIATRANAAKSGREAEFDEALDAFCDEWNRGTPERARFEKEYLLAVGERL